MLSGISRAHRVWFGVLLLLAMLGVIVFWFHESRMHLIQESAARVPDRMIASKAADLVRHPAGQVRAPNKSEDPNASRVPTEQVGSEIDSRTIESCHGALVSLKYLRARNCADKIKPGDNVDMQLCQISLASDAALVQKLTTETASCTKILATASDYYKALRDAARNGDVKAQQCFLVGYFNDAENGDRINQAQRDEYVPLARAFIQAGFERGDWGLVRWLARGRLHGPDGLLNQAYPFGPNNPKTYYKMNLLLTLSVGANTVDDDAHNIVSHFRSSGELSPQQLQEVEEWARDTYSQHFIATPYNEKAAASSFCQSQ